jgi:hypothetical protein
MRFVLGLIVLVTPVLVPAMARAQQVLQVDLELLPEIEVVPLPQERAKFKADLATALREKVAKLLPYWDFQYPPGPGQLPRLTIETVPLGTSLRPESWGADIDMRLTDTNGDDQTLGPQLPLFEKGELKTFIDAGPERLLTEIPKRFDRLVLHSKSKYQEGLMKVPLAVDGLIVPLPEDFRAVLPLKWDRFGRCASSDFLIQFWFDQGTTNAGIAVVYSKGVGDSAKSPDLQMEGIVVRHNYWQHPGSLMREPIESRKNELAKLKKGLIFFEKVPQESIVPPKDATSNPNPNPNL